MIGRRVAFATLGCKLNFVESEEMQQLLRDQGHAIVPFGEEVDFTVINTCTVTGKSDFKSRRLISKARRTNPQGKIIVTGCYAELDPGILAELEGVSAVLGLGQERRLAQVMEDLWQGHAEKVAPRGESDARLSVLRRETNLSRAFIKVQRGCNNRCTFCRVWQARGPSVSEPIERILAQTALFLDQGFEELVLTGVDMGSWGKDLDSKRRFSDLLAQLVALQGKFRIRLSSIYPMDIDENVFNLLTEHQRVCRHLHLPLQSGSPTVLNRMGRHMSPDQFIDLTRRLHDAAGRFGIGADVIAGFPGESERDFNLTREVVERSAITYLHVFPYSPRRGTAAARFPDQLAPDTIKHRARALRELGEIKRAAFRASHPGGPVEVLVERRKDRKTGLLTGFTSGYLRVFFHGPDEWMGKLRRIDFSPGLSVG